MTWEFYYEDLENEHHKQEFSFVMSHTRDKYEFLKMGHFYNMWCTYSTDGK